MGNLRFYRRTIAKTLALVAVLTSLGAASQTGSLPLRLIVPLSVGSAGDAFARSVQQPLSVGLGRPVVIENIPGAGGMTGTAQLVRAPNDGSTIAVVSSSHVINPFIYRSMQFDALKDVTPIAVVGTSPLVLLTHPSVPVKTLQEFITLAKANPNVLNYSSAGNGSVAHIATEMLSQQAGIKTKHIPYKGVAPQMTDVVGGQVQYTITSVAAALQLVKAGKLNAIGVTGEERSPQLPTIPTFIEGGLPDFQYVGWLAVIGPAGLPPAQIETMSRALKGALSNASVRESLEAQGFTVPNTSPSIAKSFFEDEMMKHAILVKQSGATAE